MNSADRKQTCMFDFCIKTSCFYSNKNITFSVFECETQCTWSGLNITVYYTCSVLLATVTSNTTINTNKMKQMEMGW